MVPRWFTRSVLSRRSAGGRPIFTGDRSAPGDLGPARRLQRPRTRLADAVEELLQDSSPRFLVDHCHRSLELALLIAAASGADLDVEVLHAGVLLHDLGLTPRFHSPTLRFEVASADAARDLVRAHGMDPARADKVWDVAVLHATGGIADCKSPETADAIGTDVTGLGLGLDRFDPDGLARIMATRPGFARPFTGAVVTDPRDTPQVASW
jgi:HD domain-containing protein